MRQGNKDSLEKFQESFRNLEGNIHVLERAVPVVLQMAYFKYSERLRRRNAPPRPLSAEECESMYATLCTNDLVTVEGKKHILSQLATSQCVRAYRLLEEYAQIADPDVLDWAAMALMESRMFLESTFSEEKQIYISSGLGGRGEKLRFYVLLMSKDRVPFKEYQRQTIEREFAFYLPKMDCEIERLSIGEQYVELVFLVPYRVELKPMLDRVIEECNQYGDFLSGVALVSNVKELTPDEVADIINKHENNKAGH